MTATLTTNISGRITFSLEWVHLVIVGVRRFTHSLCSLTCIRIHTRFTSIRFVRSKFETSFSNGSYIDFVVSFSFYFIFLLIVSFLYTQNSNIVYRSKIVVCCLLVVGKERRYGFKFLFDSLFIYTLQSINIMHKTHTLCARSLDCSRAIGKKIERLSFSILPQS